MGQHVPTVKTISPLHNSFFSPICYCTQHYPLSKQTSHLVKMVHLQNIFLTKNEYNVCTDLCPVPFPPPPTPPKHPIFCKLLVEHRGQDHTGCFWPLELVLLTVPAFLARALQQPFWVVCSAMFTVNSTVSSCCCIFGHVAVIWYVGVLILYCCSNKLTGLEQHPWFTAQICGSKVQVWLGSAGSPLKSVAKLKSRCW